MHTCPQKHLNGRRIPLWTGRGCGGTTNINASLYQRGRKTDYEQWPWSSDFVEAGFSAVEADLQPEIHEAAAMGLTMASMAEEAGFKRLPAPTSVPWTQDGVRTAHHCTTRSGRRLTAWEAFVAPLLGSSNLTVMSGTAVMRLIIENSRAVGIEAVTVDSAAPTLLASRKSAPVELRLLHPEAAEVVLCCGAVGTPKVLLLSGIGPRSHLDELGIPLQCNSPAVGSNLQDHLILVTVHATRQRITEEMITAMNAQGFVEGRTAGGTPVQLMLADSWDLPNKAPLLGVGSGPISRSDSQLMRFVRWALTVWLRLVMLLAPLRWLARQNMGSVLCLVGPKSRGTVRLSSADPHAAALVDPNYLSQEADWAAMHHMFTAVRSMQQSATGRAWCGAEVLPGLLYRGAAAEADFRRWVGDFALSYFHLVGSCAMGDAPTTSVCTPRLAVRGIAGLRIADASVAPSIPCAPVQAMTMMLGDRAADMIIADRAKAAA
jgi:choline dehydrogenase